MRTLYKKNQNNENTLLKKQSTMRTLCQLFMNLTLLQSLKNLCLF